MSDPFEIHRELTGKSTRKPSSTIGNHRRAFHTLKAVDPQSGSRMQPQTYTAPSALTALTIVALASHGQAAGQGSIAPLAMLASRYFDQYDPRRGELIRLALNERGA